MTEYIKREDAILAITRKHDEVLSVAEVIEDLESVPSADLVSREDYEGLELVCKNYEEALKDAVDELEKSGRKRGEIITNEFGNESCSVCHCGLVLFLIDENNALIKPNFCPNCGARIESEGEDG